MKRIVIADDSAVSRELIREVLGTENYEIVEACDGRQALEKVLETNPDVVLMDIQMPVLDGYRVIETLKSDPRFDRVRVVALTAFAMRGDRERALASGFDAYITKPIKASLLRKEVQKLLGPAPAQP
jgi:two-component system cell cycle response regulator DivK